MCQTIQKRISDIRKELAVRGLDAFIIPSSDPHQSEYLPDHWKLREWATGFTGSAGQALVTQNKAWLWTDSRYWLQAEQELDGTGIQLQKSGYPSVPLMSDFLLSEMSENARVGVNPYTTSVNSWRRLKSKLSAKNIELDAAHQVVLDAWKKEDRTEELSAEIYYHGERFVDRSISEKLRLVRSKLEKGNSTVHLITTLDDIAWLYNLRGSDISNNPVFLSYALVYPTSAFLFCDQKRLTKEAQGKLFDAGVTILPYDSVKAEISQIELDVVIDPDQCNLALYNLIPQEGIKEAQAPSRIIKACKTDKEVAHIEQAMIKDGIALAHAFHYLFSHLGQITEYEFAEKIAFFRSQQPDYVGESFPAIVGYEANGAIVHYRPALDSPLIMPKGLLLCDSGGQYLDGTTDITRTVAVGPTTSEQREMYTRVLKGHIALDKALFPKGKVGRDLDVFARMHLWEAGKDFGHGTGHGVGYFLNVHEPPQSISPGKSARANTELLPGMLTSNEPGYYKDDSYGIRIENLILCESSSYKGYLKHRHLTLFPIDTSIIERHLLTKKEVNWINTYHELVKSKVSPHLDGAIKSWLVELCKAI